jgi:hypothetical protein
VNNPAYIVGHIRIGDEATKPIFGVFSEANPSTDGHVYQWVDRQIDRPTFQEAHIAAIDEMDSDPRFVVVDILSSRICWRLATRAEFVAALKAKGVAR